MNGYSNGYSRYMGSNRTPETAKIGDEMALIDESIEHGERARYLAAAAVKDLQCGRGWTAEGAMGMVAMERHLQYEKWDTHEIAWRALKECWASQP